MAYRPPFLITDSVLKSIADIEEMVITWSFETREELNPQLRRNNRIRTIHASLAIENNSLSEKQVSAVIEGKTVLGQPREIQEVRNAFLAYEEMSNWQPENLQDLLKAHEILMRGLVDEAGKFRSGLVGIYKDQTLIHMAPPAERVPHLIQDLLDWLSKTETHPLINSCVFHYEFEFIHPFSDGNGRMGRLWQSLILSKYVPFLAYLPVETVVHKQQEKYYQVLGACDKAGDSTLFIEFMLDAIKQAMAEVV
ncbi:MAG: Fic family protein [Proteobacteria bacterium]|nr:Fic family protein [Pseudomonadota bacterium]